MGVKSGYLINGANKYTITAAPNISVKREIINAIYIPFVFQLRPKVFERVRKIKFNEAVTKNSQSPVRPMYLLTKLKNHTPSSKSVVNNLGK